MLANLSFCPEMHSIKNSEEGKNERLKRSFSNHWLIVRFNLSSDDVKNCKETTLFTKESEKIIKCKKTRIFNLAYKQGFLFWKSKKLDKFK